MPSQFEESDPHPSRITLRDIAKKIGCSHVTVSLALRNSRQISEAVRTRICEVAEQMGYRPDPLLRALTRYRNRCKKIKKPVGGSIGWINAWPNALDLRRHKEFDLYWQAAYAAAEKHGYRLEEFRLDRKYSPQRLRQILYTRGIRGLLLPPQPPSIDWCDFPWEEYSVVRFGRSLQHPRSHLVAANQVANTLLAYDEIKKRGYRRIGLVTDDALALKRGHFFEGGFLMAQRTEQEKDRVPIFPFRKYDPTARGRRLAGWLRKHKVDAIFTDIAELPDVLYKQNIQVPGDVGLAVTSVLDANADAGIYQEAEEIGRTGFLMLDSLIQDGDRGIPRIFRQVLVEGTWVDGDSLPDRR
jgi:LacI family transcriptional regulator